MTRLTFYVSDDVAAAVKSRAKSQGLSLSSYLAQLVRDDVAGQWPAGFFDEVVGGWRGQPLRRPSKLA